MPIVEIDLIFATLKSLRQFNIFRFLWLVLIVKFVKYLWRKSFEMCRMDLSPLRSNLVRPELFSYTLSSILPINFSLSLSAWLKSRITQFFTFETIIQILFTYMTCNYSNGYYLIKFYAVISNSRSQSSKGCAFVTRIQLD